MDCTTAITLDPLYVKAYLRRAAARVGLQHLAPALEDYRRVLQLEPTNKQARTEIDRLEKVCVFVLAGYWQGGGLVSNKPGLRLTGWRRSLPVFVLALNGGGRKGVVPVSSRPGLRSTSWRRSLCAYWQGVGVVGRGWYLIFNRPELRLAGEGVGLSVYE